MSQEHRALTVKSRPPCSQTSRSHSTQIAPAMGHRQACLHTHPPTFAVRVAPGHGLDGYDDC